MVWSICLGKHLLAHVTWHQLLCCPHLGYKLFAYHIVTLVPAPSVDGMIRPVVCWSFAGFSGRYKSRLEFPERPSSIFWEHGQLPVIPSCALDNSFQHLSAAWNQKLLVMQTPMMVHGLSIAPVCQSLTSQVTYTLLSPRLLWSIIVRHSQITTRALIPSKVVLCSAIQVGNLRWSSVMVTGVRTCMKSANWDRKQAIYLTSQKRDCMSVVFLGTGQSKILLTSYILSINCAQNGKHESKCRSTFKYDPKLEILANI